MPKPVILKPEPILLRNSERGVFKTCRLRWWWAYVDRYVPKGAPARALSFGTLVHEALAQWYIPGRKRGRPPWETFREEYMSFVDEFGRLNMRSEEEWVDALDMGEFMLRHYVDHYGKEEDRWDVVSPEQSCQVDVVDPDTDKYMFTYVFTVDAAVRDLKNRGKLGMMEHKTSASVEKPGTPTWLDEQGRSYWTFGEPWLIWEGYLGWDESVDYLVYNILRKSMPDTRPKNAQGFYLNKPSKDVLTEKCLEMDIPVKGLKVDDLIEKLEAAGSQPLLLGEVSKSQPPKYFARETIFVTELERLNMLDRVIAEFKEMQMVKRGELHIGKNPGQHCNFCEFRDICELQESGNDWQSVAVETFKKGDPYLDHREKTGAKG